MTQYGIFIEENDKLYLNLILEKIYENTKYDFRNYRESTLFRRISRRLYNSSSINFEQYYNYLDLHSNEYANLIKDLTINVTEFFRDIEYWNSFTSNHIVQIIKNSVSERKNSINIWSAGCASGEEAYSAAILFYDFIKTNNIPLHIKVTGTDISSDHLETAESGIYNCDKIISGFFPEYEK
ncbi:hypothetical protein KA977_14485, partial [Candidatus Dependentiae bacterium]|nr:hypothetical protein [Candidatus Dependentiae bacterium]